MGFVNTQTHLLLSAALFATPGRPLRNAAALAGGLVPDLSIFVMYGWGKLNSVSERVIFREWYFEPVWQEAGAITNSWPIYLGIGMAAVGMGGNLGSPQPAADHDSTVLRWRLVASAALVFALAAALHVATDMPVHVNDGRPAFWPFSDWIFRAPVSYWDTRYYGSVIAFLELVLALGLCGLLWRRFRTWVPRAALVAALSSYAVVAHHWMSLFG